MRKLLITSRKKLVYYSKNTYFTLIQYYLPPRTCLLYYLLVTKHLTTVLICVLCFSTVVNLKFKYLNYSRIKIDATRVHMSRSPLTMTVANYCFGYFYGKITMLSEYRSILIVL